MVFAESIGLIAIYGGTDDVDFFNDLHILRLDNYHWQKVINSQGISRAFHCASCIGSKMYLFGGYADKGFVSSDVHYVELDQNIAKMQQRKISMVAPRKSAQKKVIIDIPDKPNKNKSAVELLSFNNLNSAVPMPGT